MSLSRLAPFVRRFGYFGSVVLLATGLAGAQSLPSLSQSGTDSFSTSNDPQLVQMAEAITPSGLAALPAAPKPSAGAASQDYGNRGWRQNAVNKLAFEVGGGFNAPTDKNYITWGGQFTVGAGINFSKRFALLAEYQLIADKLPGALIAETGANGGNAHIWSLTLAPVVSLFPKSSNDVYVTGGGGFYRKVTSFTNPVAAYFCNYYYGYCGVGTVNQVVGHFSSNQGGWNIGMGYQRRLGGMYQESKTKLFVEARYVDVLTPAVNGISPNGLGVTTVAAGTKVIPVSVGVRW
jgi:hypothetical protein